MKTAYEVLGLNRDAALIDIEHSYRHLLNAHGARSSDGRLSDDEHKRLRQLRQAYVLLSSPSQRAAYDQHLLACAQRRRRRIHALYMMIAVLSLLGGLVLIGTGLYATARQDDSVEADNTPARDAIVQAAQEVRHGAGQH